MQTAPTHETPTHPPAGPRNPFFPMVLFSASIFILTILAMVATIFSDPRAPAAKFLDAHSGGLIAVEVVVTLILGFCALVVDRMQSRRRKSTGPEAGESSPAIPPENSQKS